MLLLSLRAITQVEGDLIVFLLLGQQLRALELEAGLLEQPLVLLSADTNWKGSAATC